MANKIYSVYTDAPQKPSAGLFGETPQKIKFREEQIDAISRAKRHFEKKEGMQQYLWNAKMRFGKTFASYQLARKMGLKRVLVLTFKPAVESAWREDLISHVDFEGWQFVSNKDAHNNNYRQGDAYCKHCNKGCDNGNCRRSVRRRFRR